MATRFTVLLLGLAMLFVPLTKAAAAPDITSSALDYIVIVPNDRPTRVDVLTDQQFAAMGYTKDGLVLSGLTFSWSTTGDIGKISSAGIFTGERGGIGQVIARNGAVTASVGVVVRGVAQPLPSAPDEKPLPSSTTVVNTNTDATSEERPANESTVKDEEAPAAATAATTSCTTIRAWVWVLILLLYCILVFAYYLSLGESRTIWWWFWPALFTAAPVLLYFGTRCGVTHVWIPWAIGVLGVLISVFYYRVLRPTHPLTVQKLQ